MCKAGKVPWKDLIPLENVPLCLFPHLPYCCLKWVYHCWSFDSIRNHKWCWRGNGHAILVEQKNAKRLVPWWWWDCHASSGLFTYQLILYERERNMFLSNCYFEFSIFETKPVHNWYCIKAKMSLSNFEMWYTEGLNT